MAYPKPFAESTLAKKYKETELSPETIEILKKFFISCACLYGAIFAEDMWQVYKELLGKGEVPRVKQKDIYGLLPILRRDGSMPFRVYEISEIYADEKDRPKDRLLSHKELTPPGVREDNYIYPLQQSQNFYAPYHVPDHFLDFQEIPVTKEEQRLLRYVGNLKVIKGVIKESDSDPGKTYEHAGERLDSFCYLSDYEKFYLNYYKNKLLPIPRNLNILHALENKFCKKNTAVKLVGEYKFLIYVGGRTPAQEFGLFMNDLNEVGADITRKRAEKLASLLFDMYNHSYLWTNRGWPPKLLAETKMKEMKAKGIQPSMPSISFGPGIEQAIREEKMDREALIRKIQELGMKVIT